MRLEEEPGRSPPAGERFWVALAVSAWAVLALAHCGRALLTLYSERHLTVYHIYHKAGQDWLAGRDVYLDRDGYDIFRYSPLVAALFAPCGAGPVVLGCLWWRLFNLALYLAGLAAFARACLPASWSRSRRAGFYLLAGLAGASGLLDAVANAPLIGLMLLALAAALGERWWASAACLALAVLFKIYPVSLALLLVLLWPRQLGWRFAAALAAGLALPFLLGEPDYVLRQYEGWLRIVSLNRGRDDWPLEMSYRDVRLLFRVWLTPVPAGVYAALQLGAALALAGLALLARRRRVPAGPRLGLLVSGLAVGWMLLLGPAAEGTTYVLLSPFLAWALLDAWGRPAAWPARALLTAAFVLLVTVCAAVWFPGGKLLHNYGPHPVCGLVVTGYLLARLAAALQQPQGEAAEAPAPGAFGRAA